MKINLLSDIHLEHGDFIVSNEDSADVLVLAGDICGIYYFVNALQKGFENQPEPALPAKPSSAQMEIHRYFYMERFFAECSRLYKRVLYVFGNHEFWNIDMLAAKVFMKNYLEKKYPNITVLDDHFVDIDGVRFIGSTFWTNANGANPQTMMQMDTMKDFHYILYGHPNLFTVNKAVELHKASMDFIEASLSTELENVIITHHCPCHLSISEHYKGHVDNPAYYTEYGNWIAYQDNIKFWFHGHLHNNSDYVVGTTRIVCNPRGYYGVKLNDDFKPEADLSV